VVIESFKDKTPSLSVIEASIVVSRDSQKLIVIGKAGNKLKEVGTKAREKLEEVNDSVRFHSLMMKCICFLVHIHINTPHPCFVVSDEEGVSFVESEGRSRVAQ